jgi:hypothetical protein
MEYFRDENNRMRAGFALHVGRLLDQYTKFNEGITPSERYDATLAISLLHSLLANCWELIVAMKKNQKGMWLETVSDVPGLFGIRRSHVKQNTFSSDPTKLTYSEFIKHLRNAISHPTYPEKLPKYPSTGYTTVQDGTGIISQFRFTDSPWVDRGIIFSRYMGNDEERVRKEANDFSKRLKHQCGKLDVNQNSDGNYQIFYENEPYLPIFEAELPHESLKKLVLELANYLAQPTQEDWDGKSIARLVA